MHNPGRSWLVVPLSKPADVARAAQSGADVVVLDLVEFVAAPQKAAVLGSAHAAVQQVRANAADGADGPRVFVQTTHQSHEADLRACVCPALTGVVVSRAESAQQLQDIDKYLFLLEKEQGVPQGSIEIVAALETARGNQEAYEIISASKRVRGVTLGRADLVMDLRPEPSGDMHLMPYLMQRLIIIARAVGVAPLGAWWRAPDRGLLSTPENTLQAAKRGRAMGFKGALCLRADQIEPLNKIYAQA